VKNSKQLLLIILLTFAFVLTPIPTLFADPEADLLGPNSNPISPEDKKKSHTVQIAVFGDIMMHSPQIKAGEQNNKYDFSHFFHDVKPYLERPDIAVGNLELTLAGPSKPYTGYPLFNSPDEIIDALLASGVDAVSTANNHSMDTGEAGVRRTLQVLKEKKLKAFGTASSQEERNTPLIIEKNGIKIAFLAYTESTNGNPVPKDYLVNRIDLPLIRKDIQKAKEMGADFVSVSLHWGVEYQRKPNEFQKKTAQEVLKAGADVIVGSHPHVVQPIEKVTIDGQEKLIIYSLGNFVSNQQDTYTDEGLIVYFDIARDPTSKKVKLIKVSFLPTYVHKYNKNGKRQYTVLPLEKEAPTKLPDYPELTVDTWKRAYRNTHSLLTENTAFPTFSLK
jgi:poly-gamma-glutamate synthesis protein (capsule biosynthesis protein)